ncbi:NepR family anti-sigma factor [Pleomorphomonas sp. JP5]|uniref:NepR family anti-sigma factor n=1 Tax=Pleomorphomonas sp. JP5 TaxID=2942998 RepID=UPI0020441381|nr:NepR family anti-sigma factor [Pleomorphomonas sp. JP5]MCM5558811.1 hypothetical protein [Pleomorphomonas sp. JP5]
MSDKKETSERPTLEPPIQAHLGDQLKKLYGSILSEPIPEKLTMLLDQLEKSERKEREGQSEGGDGGSDQ